MNKNIYQKTRYQNIYRHKKNGNYIISISKPVKTSISEVNGNKIMRLEDAVKIRDNPKIKLQKGAEIACNGYFDDCWLKYMYHCKYELKLAYNTIIKKNKVYNAYLKNNFPQKLPKITKEVIYKVVDNLNTTDKQKNEVLDEIKAFFKWCKHEKYIILNPAEEIKKYKVVKSEMKYWSLDNLNQFLRFINDEVSKTKSLKKKELFLRIRLITLLGIILGDRPGETRALTFSSFDNSKNKVSILHSINYDRKSEDYLSTTKTYGSQREFFITDKLLTVVNEYKTFLKEEMRYNVKDSNLIIWNYESNRPFSDTTLRNSFSKICEKAKVPKIRLYDLRHTFVALMMEENVELYQISSQMGHTNYSTTVNKYGHISENIKKGVAKITDKFY